MRQRQNEVKLRTKPEAGGLFFEQRASALLFEFLNAWYLTGASLAAHVAVKEMPESVSESTIVSYLPPVPTTYASNCELPAVGAREQSLAAALHQFYAMTMLSQSHTMCVSALAGQLGRYDLQLLSDAIEYWRKSASIGSFIQNEVCLCVPAETTRTAYDRIIEVRGFIEQTLQSVDDGGSVRGSLVLPAWVERRAAPRISINRQTCLFVGGLPQKVLVENMSKYGLCVWGVEGAEPRMPLRVMLRPGETIRGRFAWVDGKRAGIQLDEPLPPEWIRFGRSASVR